jgi:DNA-binding transcriptional ArsR family regulator
MILEGLFGNETASKVLLYLESYGSGYPRGISETFEISISQVQRQLERFESEGVLASRLIGRTRQYEWNPRCFYLSDLRSILSKSLERLPATLTEKHFRSRMRPRKAGKPLP